MQSPGQEPELEPDDESGKLRRWVSNLQLESWQLELLITGFSIFLLGTSLEGYETIRRDFVFNKLRPDAGTINPLVAASLLFMVNAIPLVLRFLLINLLVHLLLRGFWIGIVGLSSVSSQIAHEKLNLKGKFRKYIGENVMSLDGLIVYLDKVSSVIFAYTYLLVFSILSVVIVTGIIFSTAGSSAWLMSQSENAPWLLIVNVILWSVITLLILGAIIFFLDTLLFSAFKKSKWFSSIYYPIYRFFSIISLSIVYRSIYYHLITNFKKKQIISVALILLGLFFISKRIDGWNNYKFFPKDDVITEYYLTADAYDDERVDEFIDKASLPSKFVKGGFLELFLRYNPSDNDILKFLCPTSENLDRSVSFNQEVKASFEAQRDTTITFDELVSGGTTYRERVDEAAQCIGQLYEVWIDGIQMENPEYLFQIHPNKGERGFLTVLDVSNLERGKHVIEIKKQVARKISFMQDLTESNLSIRPYAKLNFWTQ